MILLFFGRRIDVREAAAGRVELQTEVSCWLFSANEKALRRGLVKPKSNSGRELRPEVFQLLPKQPPMRRLRTATQNYRIDWQPHSRALDSCLQVQELA